MKNFRIIGYAVLVPLFLAFGVYAGEEKTTSQTGEATKKEFVITVASKESIAFLGSLDSFEITEAGTQAGKFLLNYLEGKNPEDASLAVSIYKRIIPIENYGGEYSALQWFGEYFLANEEERQAMLADRYVKAFFDYMAADNFAPLKEYIIAKYKLGERKDEGSKAAIERERFLEDFILFNNPKREEWEATSKIIEVLGLKQGMRIADVGSGPGYYSFKFSDIVGPEGQVYAIDTVKKHLEFISSVIKRYGISNIETIHTKSDSIGSVPENTIDLVTMVSLYHIVYLTSLEKVKDRFVNSIKRALRPNGRLVIVDNALVDQEEKLPYHGPYIAKELIIAQLYYYGFDLVSQYQFIPQRYILVFRLRPK